VPIVASARGPTSRGARRARPHRRVAARGRTPHPARRSRSRDWRWPSHPADAPRVVL